MKITYRDNLGIIEMIVDENSIDFVNGFAFFSSGDNDYKISVESIVCIGNLE